MPEVYLFVWVEVWTSLPRQVNLRASEGMCSHITSRLRAALVRGAENLRILIWVCATR